MHILLIQACREKLHIATSAVNVLLVFHCELHNQGLVLVAEGIKASRDGIEASILAGLKPWEETIVAASIAVM